MAEEPCVVLREAFKDVLRQKPAPAEQHSSELYLSPTPPTSSAPLRIVESGNSWIPILIAALVGGLLALFVLLCFFKGGGREEKKKKKVRFVDEDEDEEDEDEDEDEDEEAEDAEEEEPPPRRTSAKKKGKGLKHMPAVVSSPSEADQDQKPSDPNFQILRGG